MIISEVCQSPTLFESNCVSQIDYLFGFEAMDLESYSSVENESFKVKVSYLQEANFSLGNLEIM
jgi:hypothetical protein